MKLTSAVVCACLTAGICQPGDIPWKNADAKLLDNARAQYYSAVEGQRGALENATKLWRELREQYPDHPTVLAYAGSTQLLNAAKTLAVWRKGKLTQEGLATLDDAVGRAPDNLEVRFVRAASTFHLPGFIGRRPQSQTDFAWLAPQSCKRLRMDCWIGVWAQQLSFITAYSCRSPRICAMLVRRGPRLSESATEPLQPRVRERDWNNADDDLKETRW